MADLRTLEKQLDALGNRNRLRILKELKSKRTMTAGKVAKFLGVSPAAASQHLHILSDADIVKRTKRGRFVIYRLAIGGERWIKLVIREGL